MLGTNTISITQQLFRIALDSTAHPGRIAQLPAIAVKSGKAEYDSFDALLYTLLDHETSFSVIGTEVREEFIDKIYRLTKSRYTDIEQADYVVISGGSSGRMLEHVRRGDLEFPDKGATVFYRVENLGGPDGIRLTVRGPGVKNQAALQVSGADPEDLAMLNLINSEFPLGIDIICVDRSMKIVCIPRSSNVTIEQGHKGA